MAASKSVTKKPNPDADIVLSHVSNLLEMVPDAGGDGTSILTSILDAKTAEDLVGDDTEGLPDISEFYDHDLRVDRIEKVESDYQGQDGQISPYYLVIHGHDLTDGRPVITTTSGATPMVKLAKLREFHAFPAVVRFSLARKQTRQGFFPINMSVLTVTTNTIDA